MAAKHKSDESADEPLETKLDDIEPVEAPVEEKEDSPEEDTLLEAKPKKPAKGKSAHGIKGVLASKKFRIGLAAFVAAVLIVLAVPATRYTVLGLFIQKNFSVTVLDSESGKPISGALVSIVGNNLQTDAETDVEGKATLTGVKPGQSDLNVVKKYYSEFSEPTMVTLDDTKNNKQIKLQATGRQVPVTIKNKINGKVLADATVTVLDTTAKTDANGEAVIVLPPNQKTEKATVTLGGYNEFSGTIEITEQKSDKNVFGMTPSGSIYFLSKKSGKVDVVKTNLDGSDRKVVLAGTGNEDFDTVLMASRDWGYLFLKSKRDGGKYPKLFLIDTKTDKLTVVDEGDVFFSLHGWADNNFVYSVDRVNRTEYQSRKYALKTYDAQNNKHHTLDESEAAGYQGSLLSTRMVQIRLLGSTLTYVRLFQCDAAPAKCAGKVSEIILVKGSQKTVLKSLKHNLKNGDIKVFDVDVYPAKPDEAFYRIHTYYKLNYLDDGVTELFKLVNGKLEPVKDSGQTERDYPNYLLSPSGNETFWAESRDGKYSLFLGNKSGDSSNQINESSEQNAFGWFTDEYLLVSKNDSELYIMSKDKNAKPFKISDFHRQSFY